MRVKIASGITLESHDSAERTGQSKHATTFLFTMKATSIFADANYVTNWNAELTFGISLVYETHLSAKQLS